ncbi:MAG TPA: hypothetical protein VKX46_21830 [Ktedonobacteraceae bacterium]|nr:hypothetical protein [Ktedonobacteraceae bacterium]
MQHPPSEASLLKAQSAFLFVIILIGALWALLVAASLHGPGTDIFLVVVLLLSIMFLAAAFLFVRAARTVPSAPSPLAHRSRRLVYIASILFEVVLILVGRNLLNTLHRSDYIFSLIAFAVGLHFLGLVYVFQTRWYAVYALIFCAIALLVLALPPHIVLGAYQIDTWSWVIGIVCAGVLWGRALLVLNKARSHFHLTTEHVMTNT